MVLQPASKVANSTHQIQPFFTPGSFEFMDISRQILPASGVWHHM